MNTPLIRLLLADDDIDDCNLFKEVLKELPLKIELLTINNNEYLVKTFLDLSFLPAAIFLDLNMPKKNGIECLNEIKTTKKLKGIPIIVYSTSFEPKIVNLLYNKGAHYYIRKPADFQRLKQIIYNGILLAVKTVGSKPKKENFVLHS